MEFIFILNFTYAHGKANNYNMMQNLVSGKRDWK